MAVVDAVVDPSLTVSTLHDGPTVVSMMVGDSFHGHRGKGFSPSEVYLLYPLTTISILTWFMVNLNFGEKKH